MAGAAGPLFLHASFTCGQALATASSPARKDGHLQCLHRSLLGGGKAACFFQLGLHSKAKNDRDYDRVRNGSCICIVQHLQKLSHVLLQNVFCLCRHTQHDVLGRTDAAVRHPAAIPTRGPLHVCSGTRARSSRTAINCFSVKSPTTLYWPAASGNRRPTSTRSELGATPSTQPNK